MDIYIVEDDKALCREMRTALEKWGYDVGEVNNFEKITEEVLAKKPKLILMDINLPSYDGFYWCQDIRNFVKVPVIFISSRDSDMDVIMSINMGGDEYIVKPFSPQLLIAKVQAIFRRTYSYNAEMQPEILQCGDVILHLVDATLHYKEKQVELTKNEFKILHMLMQKQGQIVHREKIIDELWNTDEFISDNTLTVNMNRIRKKLENIGINDFVITKKSQGYMVP